MRGQSWGRDLCQGRVEAPLSRLQALDPAQLMCFLPVAPHSGDGGELRSQGTERGSDSQLTRPALLQSSLTLRPTLMPLAGPQSPH